MEEEITYSLREAIEKMIGAHENSNGDQELVDHFEEHGTVAGSMTFQSHVLSKLLEMDEIGAIKLGEVSMKYENLGTTDFEWGFTK